MIPRAVSGPRPAAWCLRVRSGATTTSADRAHIHYEAIRRTVTDGGRVPTIEREEYCITCGGAEYLRRMGRGRMVREIPCPSHVDTHVTIEPIDLDLACASILRWGDSARLDAIRDQTIDVLWPDDPVAPWEIRAYARSIARIDPGLGTVATWRATARDRMVAECSDGGRGIAARLVAIESEEWTKAGRP